MKLSKEYPPNIDKIRKVLNPPLTACFTYGDTIYNPSCNPLYPDMMIHEQVHEKQQSNPEEWWDKYLEDKDFRMSQEVEAYATQYNWVKSKKLAKMSKRYLEMFAHHLSTIYGLDLTFDEAYSTIRIKAKEIVDNKKDKDVV